MARTIKNHNNKRLEVSLEVFGRKLKVFREELGLSQEELGRQAKVNASTISEIENLKVSDVKLSTVLFLADAFELNGNDWVTLLLQSELRLSDNQVRSFRQSLKALTKIERTLPES